MQNVWTTEQYLTEYRDNYKDADSQEKGFFFLMTNAVLLQHLNCPKEFVIDLETNGCLLKNEAEEFNSIARVNSRMDQVATTIRRRTTSKWENLPFIFSLIRRYNEEVANELQARWDAVSALTC